MNPLSERYRAFVKYTLLSSGILVFFTAITNFVIDPFTIHQTPIIPKINEIKISLGKHERLYKAIEVARKKPRAVLLGSSRVLAGIDPGDVEAITGISSYNAAFSGANFEEIYYYFEHALHHQPDLKVVILGLDFDAFRQLTINPPGFRLERLKGRPINWSDFNSSLLSMQALKSSYETLKASMYSNHVKHFLPKGQANPVLSEENEIFIKGDHSYLKMILKSAFSRYKIGKSKVEMFQKLVRTCQERSIELKAFFCPTQAIYWEAIYRSHLWPLFEDLKKELSAIYPIWDFSGFNCVTERTLEQEIKQPLYYECSHFRPTVGKIIVEKMFNLSHSPTDFGVLLTPQTVEDDFENMRKRAVNWLEKHDDIMQQIEKATDW